MMEFTYEDRQDLLRWALSGAIVLALHGSIAAAMVQWGDTADISEPAAAMVIDLAPFPVSPAAVPMDIAPGPEQVEAQASPETQADMPEETRELIAETKDVQEHQPEIAPAIEPDMVAALPPKPKPEASKPQDNQTPAPVTTAPQAPPAEVAPVAAAPVQQGRPNDSDSNAIPTWRIRVVGILERNKRYPSAAQARHEQGTAQLAFSLDRRGRVTSTRILRSSGSAALDHETLELVRRAQPFPPPPAELPGTEISLSVPIRFNIR